jgi:hypothetical protein
MVDDNADVEESDKVKKERNEMQEYLILSFVDRTRIAKKTSNYTIRHLRAGQSIKTRLRLKIIRGVNQTSKPHGRPTRTVYRTTFRKTEFAPNHGVCDECSKMTEKNIVCVLCSVCVHPLPDSCRFYGDQLSCIDCYRRRHVIFVPHAIRDGDSSQLLAKKGTASNDVKTPPESKEKARLGKGWKNEDKNE